MDDSAKRLTSCLACLISKISTYQDRDFSFHGGSVNQDFELNPNKTKVDTYLTQRLRLFGCLHDELYLKRGETADEVLWVGLSSSQIAKTKNCELIYKKQIDSLFEETMIRFIGVKLLNNGGVEVLSICEDPQDREAKLSVVVLD